MNAPRSSQGEFVSFIRETCRFASIAHGSCEDCTEVVDAERRELELREEIQDLLAIEADPPEDESSEDEEPAGVGMAKGGSGGKGNGKGTRKGKGTTKTKKQS